MVEIVDKNVFEIMTMSDNLALVCRFETIILHFARYIWFVKYVFSAKIWLVKTLTLESWNMNHESLNWTLSCVHFLCSFSIKPLTCSVFDSDCLKRSYGVYYTLRPGNKMTICNVRVIRVFVIGKWNSLQGPFIIFGRAKSYFLVSVVFPFHNFSSTIYQRGI